MKKHLNLVLIVLGMITLTSINCSKELENLCDAYQKDQIERAFVISAKIIYADGVPYQGEVLFQIQKTYCNENISGRNDLNHIVPDEYGNWFSGMRYKYSFANSKDVVSIYFHIPYSDGTNDFEGFSYWYSDVENEPYEIHKTINIKLVRGSGQ